MPKCLKCATMKRKDGSSYVFCSECNETSDKRKKSIYTKEQRSAAPKKKKYVAPKVGDDPERDRQEIDKFNSVKGVKYNKRVLFNMFKRSGLTYDEALIIHTLGALDD